MHNHNEREVKGMENTMLVRKIYMECPLCDKTHEIEERKRIATTTLKGEKVAYEEHFYFCENADEEENEFETGAMTNANLMNARNAYRVRHGLLTSDEIIDIRENYGLSQVDMARLLGWGEATISRYESKAIQDEAYDTMLRLIKDNPLQALEFLKKNADKFSDTKRQEIRLKIVEKLDSYGREYLTRQTFESEYANYTEPDDSNGFILINIDKIEAIISYFAKEVANLYKVKLMKLMWYADALAYKIRGSAITGLVYQALPMGAVPVGHNSIIDLKVVPCEEVDMGETNAYHFSLKGKQKFLALSDEEKNIIDIVIEKLGKMTKNEIVAFMHAEKAYIMTVPRHAIEFKYAEFLQI